MCYIKMRFEDSKDFGFIIINPEGNSSVASLTVRTIGCHFPNAQTLCVVGKGARDIEENKKHTKVIISGNTITSLINAGLRESDRSWNQIVVAGTVFRRT